MRQIAVFVAATIACLFVVAGSTAQAIPIDKYSLDIEITHAAAAGAAIGVAAGDIFLNAGKVTIDLAGVTGTGVEAAQVTDFTLSLGSEQWNFLSGSVGTPNFGVVSSPNYAEYTNGSLTRIFVRSVSASGLLLELDGTFSTNLVGQMSMLVDNYHVGEVVGLYGANPIPEPGAAFLFVMGSAIVVRSRRLR